MRLDGADEQISAEQDSFVVIQMKYYNLCLRKCWALAQWDVIGQADA
jgi:hypothetical protein